MLSIFGSLIRQYFLSNPQVVERLTNAVLHALIEHIAPTTAAELGGLTGEASASPLASGTAPIYIPVGLPGVTVGPAQVRR